MAGRPHLPAGLPGSIKWQSEQLGVDPYQLALSAAHQPGHTGRQARFYMAMTMHQKLRGMAHAAAAHGPQPTA